MTRHRSRIHALHALVVVGMALGSRTVHGQRVDPPPVAPPPTSVQLPEDDDADLGGFEPAARPSGSSRSIAPLAIDPRERPPRPAMPGYPIRVPDRPLTLPPWWLVASMGFGFAPGRVCIAPTASVTECATRETTHLIMSGTYGFSRWLTVQTSVAARLYPDVQGDPFSTRFRFRVLDRGGHRLVFDVAYGQSLGGTTPVTRRLEVGPYAALRISPRARFRLGADVGFAATGSNRRWALGMPIAVDLAPIPRLYLRLETRASLLGRHRQLEGSWELPAALEIGGVLIDADGRPALELFGRSELDPVGTNVSIDRLTNRWSVAFGFRYMHAQQPPEWRLRRQSRRATRRAQPPR